MEERKYSLKMRVQEGFLVQIGKVFGSVGNCEESVRRVESSWS